MILTLIVMLLESLDEGVGILYFVTGAVKEIVIDFVIFVDSEKGTALDGDHIVQDGCIVLQLNLRQHL